MGLTKKQADDARHYAQKAFDSLCEIDCAGSVHLSHHAAKALEMAEQRLALPTYGVEGWALDPNNGVQYLNTGHAYGLTVLAVSDFGSIKFEVGSWGDFAERE